MFKQCTTFVVLLIIILIVIIYNNTKNKKINKVKHIRAVTNMNIYYLSPNLKKIFENNFYRHDVLGDNSCFYHSVLYCVSSSYKNFQDHQKKELVIELRNNLAKHITQEYYDREFKGFINKNTLISNLKDYNVWAGITEWKALVDYMKINIIIFRESTDDIYCGWGIDNFNYEYKTIFIINIGDYHYNPVIFINNKKIQGMFYPSSTIIKKIINYGNLYCKN